MTDTAADTGYLARLRAFEGREIGPPRKAPDPVNGPMIHHWVDVMGDRNPIYVDEDAARATGRSGTIAPPTMLQAWAMASFADAMDRETGPATTAQGELFEVLAERGFTSVVATNCEQEYTRELHPGDHLTVTESIEGVSDEKRTGLGTGHFVTLAMTFRDQSDVVVGVQRWRVLKFRPRAGDDSDASGDGDGRAPERPLRPRPAINRDNAFWFEAAQHHRLVIQRCGECGRLRHPPGPCCPHCRSFEWDTVDASGRGTIHSFVVNHHPQVPAFDYPLPVVLVELAEGVRLVANVTELAPDDIETGMEVVVDWVDHDAQLSLPAFRPAQVGGS